MVIELDSNMATFPGLPSIPSFLYPSFRQRSSVLSSLSRRGRWAAALLSPPSYGGPEDSSLKASLRAEGGREGGNVWDTAALLLLEAIITNIPWNVPEYK